MSRLALIAGLALVAPTATAQVPQADEATLLHRIAVLSVRQRLLQAQVIRRDSLAAYGPGTVVIGTAPIYFRVPAWVGARVTPMVEATVDSWQVRIGPLFSRAPVETVTVAFRSDTAGWPGSEIANMIGVFPDVVRFNATRASAGRVQGLLGIRFLEWLGPELPSVEPQRDRREAIVALARDTTGLGRRCLDGDAAACVRALDHGGPVMAGAHRSLLGSVLAPAGYEGWVRLAADSTASPESRLSAIAGVPYDQVVANWIRGLRSPPANAPIDGVGSVLAALLWSVVLCILFARSIAWHRA